MHSEGDDEEFGSKHNGNFLGCIELIARFDPFLKQHIDEYGNAGRGKPSYLSSTIVEEFIEIMAKQVRTTIIEEIQTAKYFSVSVDSTPDLSHTDQLTVIIRYVLGGKSVERFLTFLQIKSHTGEELAKTLLEYLKSEGINFMDCRGQSYDNASNMSGRYSGMQAHLRRINPLAEYIPCVAHSLNLVGCNAVDCCVQAVSFFGFIQMLYNFLSGSTHRWSVLNNLVSNDSLTVKSLSETRWSARADATSALLQSYANIKEALDEICDDEQQNGKTRHEANSLSECMEQLETAFLCEFWNEILDRINATSKKLQSPTIDLKSAVELLRSLELYFETLRDRFSDFEKNAKKLLNIEQGTGEYKKERIRKRNTKFDDGNAIASEETRLTGRTKFRVETYLVIIDKLNQAIRHRETAYQTVCNASMFYFHLMILTSMCVLMLENLQKNTRWICRSLCFLLKWCNSNLFQA